MHFKTLALAAALSLGSIAPAHAGKILDLYSTGVDASYAATTGNGVDAHWTLVGGTAYTGGTNGSFPIGPWVGDTATARWITPTNNAADGVPVTTYTFETTFTLSASNVAAASFAGKFAADDSVTAVRLNGTLIPISGGGYQSYQSFAYAGPAFVAGVNTLSFDVINSGAGPTGIQVDLAGAIPEPSTWAMMIAGFGLVGVATRRRRVVAA